MVEPYPEDTEGRVPRVDHRPIEMAIVDNRPTGRSSVHPVHKCAGSKPRKGDPDAVVVHVAMYDALPSCVYAVCPTGFVRLVITSNLKIELLWAFGCTIRAVDAAVISPLILQFLISKALKKFDFAEALWLATCKLFMALLTHYTNYWCVSAIAASRLYTSASGRT